jgi:hypothetical protein
MPQSGSDKKNHGVQIREQGKSMKRIRVVGFGRIPLISYEIKKQVK